MNTHKPLTEKKIQRRLLWAAKMLYSLDADDWAEELERTAENIQHAFDQARKDEEHLLSTIKGEYTPKFYQKFYQTIAGHKINVYTYPNQFEPCPKCGGHNIVVKDHIIDSMHIMSGDARRRIWCYCTHCGYVCPPVERTIRSRDEEMDVAREIWNSSCNQGEL